MGVIRYLAGHKLALLLAFALLVGCAGTDLALPYFTSAIVDVGIQQAGIEHVAVDAMTSSTHQQVEQLLEGSDDDALFAESYEPAENGEWRLTPTGEERRSQLDQALAEPLIAVHDPQLLQQVREADDAGTLLNQSGLAAAKAEYQALGRDTTAIQMGFLARTGLFMLGIAAVNMVLNILVGLVAARTGARIGHDLRRGLFQRIVSFSDSEIDRFSAASLITRGTNDITLIQNVCIMLVRMVFYAPIVACGGIIMIMVTNAAMGWVIVVAVAAVFAVVAVLFKLVMPKFKIMQKLIDRVNLVAREMLTGMPVVRAFDRQAFEEERFDVASTRLMRTQLFTNRAMSFMMPTMMLIMNLTSVAIVWVGAGYIDAGFIQTGDLIAFITYSMVIIMSFLIIGMMSIMLPRANVAAERVNEVLAAEPSIVDAPAAETAEAAQKLGEARDPAGARIVFDDVSFCYDDDAECALHHVSFTAEPGTTLAIIGSTGSGKTTVLKLLMRFYDVSRGRITVDGVDVRQLSQADLRAQFGYVPQKAFLFSGTVRTNVAYSDEDMPDQQVENALETAQAAGFVAEFPEGADHAIAQGGTNVSGGQRQRLAIARALASDARAYLFDDSFSALDYRTDAALRNALESRAGGATRIIVAQRVATIMHADAIVVLEEGKVAGVGTHQQLLESCEEYRQIALTQLSEAELDLDGGEAA